MIFQYDTLTVRVESRDPSPLPWLREFLTPSFAVVHGAEADWTVEFVVEDDAYAEILRSGSHAGQQLDCFILDRGTVRLPLWAATHGERILFDRALRVFYCVARDRPLARIVTASQNLAARFALMKVVRELAMSASRTARTLVLHAAALATKSGGVIIAGPKGAGKTTLLTHALCGSGVRFIANDRVAVDLNGTEPVVRGMPTLVTLRYRMLEVFSELEAPLLDCGYDHRLALGEAAPAGVRTLPPRAGCPIDLSPAQFSALLGVKMCGESSLRALVFPKAAPESGGLQVRELSAPAAAVRLNEALFGADQYAATSAVFATDAVRDIDRTDLQRLCVTLTARIPAFECQLGEQVSRTAATADELLNRILRSGPPVVADRGDSSASRDF